MRFGLVRHALRIAAGGGLLLPLVLSLTISTASAQTYVFGRADFTTGNSPVAVVTGDFNGDGKPDLVTANQADNTVSILLGQADGTFGAKKDYAVGKSPSAVAVADFNLDGKLDLAVTNSADGTVSVLLGNGDGTFQSQSVYAVGKSPSSVTAGAFNNATKNPDLAVANNGDNTVSILIGNGDGTFAPQVTYAAGNAPSSVIAGDFRDDGNLDLVVGGTGTSILLGNGDGTFGTATPIFNGSSPYSSTGPEYVAAGDLNADGKLDLVVADSANAAAEVLTGNGDGTFNQFSGYPTGLTPSAVVVADFNSDGLLDFATADKGGNDITVTLQNSTPTQFSFQLTGTQYVVGPSPSSLVTADFNGDGKPDFAVPSLSSNYVSSILGRGDGTFELRNDMTVSGDTQAYDISDGDFTNNGKLDLLVAAPYFNASNGGLYTFLGNGDGTFQTPLFDSSFTGFAATPGDFNGDGKLDLAYPVNYLTTGLEILLGNGDGTFTMAGTLAATLGTFGTPSVGDFNGDGKLDVAAALEPAGTLGNTVAVMLGNGDGTLQAPVNYTTGTGPGAVAVADLNGDGILDLAVTDLNCSSYPCSNPGLVSVLLGNGDGTFKAHVDYAVGTNPSWIVAGDFNNDGQIDLAVTNQTDQTISVLLGNGDGTFQNQVTYPEPNAGQLAAADFNADGNLDLAVVDQASCAGYPNTPWPLGIVSVLFGNGDGTFQPHTDYATTSCPVALTSGDLNGDGAPDLGVLEDFEPSAPTTTMSVLLDGPFIALYPSSLTFATQSVGTTSAAQTVTVTNPGAGALSVISISVSGDFSQSNNCQSTLSSHANCTVTIGFAPTTSGTRTGTLTITDNAATSPQSIALTGTGGTELAISPASLTFALQSIGTVSAAQVVTVTNSSDIELNFTAGATITGPNSGDFLFCAAMHVPNAVCYYESVTADCGVTPSLAPGGSCTVGIAFDPLGGGTRSATLSFSDDAAGSPQSIPLSGTAPAPVVTLSPPSLTFGDEPVGSATRALQVTLTNTGNGALSVTGITTSGDFVATNFCGSSVAVGTSCNISVVFKPSAGGARDGTLTITDSALNSPQTIALTGTGTTPAVSLSPDSLSFGPTLAGQSVVATPVLLTNTGAAPLTISSIAFTGSGGSDFSQQNNCGSSVTAGATCTINVSFKPATGGTFSANLAVTDNAAASPQLVGVTGTGNDFILAPAPGSSTSATVTAGQSATYNITVDRTGDLSGAVSLSCSGAPTAATCMVTPSSVALGVGVPSSPIVVTVTTAARAQGLARRPKWTPMRQGPTLLLGCVLAFLLASVAALRARRPAQPVGNGFPRKRSPGVATVPALMLVLVLIISACGGSSTPAMTTPTGTPAGTYMLSVTGSYTAGSASVQNNVVLSLIVQ